MIKVYKLTRSLRGLGHSIARKSRHSIARQVTRDVRIRKRIVQILQGDVH